MKNIACAAIVVAMTMAVAGGISRLTMIPFFVVSRVWAGAAVVLLLFAIALNTLPEEQ